MVNMVEGGGDGTGIYAMKVVRDSHACKEICSTNMLEERNVFNNRNANTCINITVFGKAQV